jgi:4a-hydroxytetrahydrobiopterin dehydratase
MAGSRALTGAEITESLQTLPGWSGDDKGLCRTLRFRDFPAAMRFMQACVEGIEERNHHPAWTNVYNGVEIRLSTHDIGGRVSDKDVDLARYLSSVLEEQGLILGAVDAT